jgi:acetyl esterase/lipase
MKRQHLWSGALVVLIGLSSLARSQQPAPPSLPKGVKAHRNLEYVKNGHERNKLDLYLPEKADGPLPLVVWIHGGAWWAGSKENPPALPLAARGYAVASINYRLSQHAKYPAQLQDCKAAIRWLRANARTYRLNPERIGVWGASAGGHLVALLGTTGGVKELEGDGGNAGQSSRVQAVIDWFGPSDFETIAGQAGPDSQLDHAAADSPEAKLIGGRIGDNKDKAAKASPVTYVTKEAAPFLIMHGDKDRVVPYAQSEELAEALRKAGVEVKLKKVEGAGHGGPQFGSAGSRELILAFFEKHLK